jgi:hypothetical protein
MKYIPRVDGVPQLDPGAKKDQRGFCHPSTARLLCPRSLRDKFDSDRETFCRDVQNGTNLISQDDWPSFLYPEEGYNHDAIDENILRGPFLLSVSQF